MSSRKERSGVDSEPKRPRVESDDDMEFLFYVSMMVGFDDDAADEEADSTSSNDDEEEASSEGPRIPDELVLRFASFVNQRKLYLALLTLTKEIQQKSQHITEHPRFKWPRLSLSTDSDHVSHAFTSSGRWLLQARSTSDGLTLYFLDNAFGPEEEIIVEPFWKRIKSREVKNIAKSQDIPGAYKGVFSRNGRHLLAMYEDSDRRIGLYNFARLYDLFPDDGADIDRPTLDLSRYIDLSLPSQHNPEDRHEQDDCFDEISFSPDGSHLLVHFGWKVYVFHCGSSQPLAVLDDGYPKTFCCNDAVLCQTEWSEHNIKWWGYGQSFDNAPVLIEGYRSLGDISTNPVDSTLIALVSWPPEIDPDDRHDRLMLQVVKLVKQNNSLDFDTVTRFQHRDSIKLTDDEDTWEQEKHESHLAWSSDGTHLYFNHFSSIHVFALGPDNQLLDADPSSIYSRLVDSATTLLQCRNSFDWEFRHFIKGFEVSPDNKALIVQVKDKWAEEQDTHLLCPLTR
jgi:hypothetical protein